MAHTRREENADEGNNNGLEGPVRVLEQFYTNKDSLFEDISISIKLPSVFLLQCACQETFFASVDLSEHLERHYDCRLKIKRSYLLFQDPPEESSFQREIMDNLKYFQVS